MTLLIIDIGSSSIRTLLFDAHSNPIPDAIVRYKHQFDHEQQGQSTANAQQLRNKLENCIDKILLHPCARDIQAVGMACFVGNLVGLNQAFEAQTPLYTYADSRSQSLIQNLKNQLDEAKIYQETGCRIHPAYNTAKLKWLKSTRPDEFSSIHQWSDFSTYCYQNWFNRAIPCSYSIASWSGLLDRHSLEWHSEWLETLQIKRENLPTLADYTETQQGLSKIYSKRWPLLANIPFYLALGDGAVANIGAGGISPSAPVLTIGTTAAVRIISPKLDKIPEGLWAYRVDKDHHLIGGATSEGGNLFQWAKETLKLDVNTLEIELKNLKAGQHGLTILPLFAGERSPGWQGDAVGTIHGLQLSTQPIDILQALLEAIAFRLRLILEKVDPNPKNPLIISGGALEASPAWVHMIADVMGRKLLIGEPQELTARGVALLMNQNGDLEHTPNFTQQISPDPEKKELYDRLLEQHLALYHLFY